MLVSAAEQPQPPHTPQKNKYLNIPRHSKQPSLNWISLFYRLSLPKCQKSVGLGEPGHAARPPPLGPAHPLRYQLTQSLPPSCILSPPPCSCCMKAAAEPTQARRWWREAARISRASSGDDVTSSAGEKKGVFIQQTTASQCLLLPPVLICSDATSKTMRKTGSC